MATTKSKTTAGKAKGGRAAGKPSKLPIPRRGPAAETFQPAKPAAKPGKPAKATRAPEPVSEPMPAATADAATAEATTTAASPPPPAAKLSCLDAAAEVLRTATAPMRCQELVAAMAAGGLWRSDAPTPHQTLASALLREITKKGPASRFRKADRGQFALNAEPA